jgi:hypothetical protein
MIIKRGLNSKEGIQMKKKAALAAARREREKREYNKKGVLVSFLNSEMDG